MAQKNPQRLYITDENEAAVKLPFKLINNLIIIKLQINNSDTLNFILDTGITTTIINQKDALRLQSLKVLKEYRVNGLGNGSGMLAKHSPENEVKLNGIIGCHQDLLIMEQDEPDFSNLLGIPIHGLLGYTLFKDFIIEINYDGHYLILHTPKKYTYKLKRKQISIPLSFIENKPYIEAVVIQDNNAKIPVKLIMDLGGSHSLWFNLLSNPSLQLPQRNAKMTLGVGLNGLLCTIR